MCLAAHEPGGPRQCPSHTKAALEAKEAIRDQLAERVRLYQADLAMINHGLWALNADEAATRLATATANLDAVSAELAELHELSDTQPAHIATTTDLDAVRAHYATMTTAQLRAEIDTRTTSPQFAELLAARDAARDRKNAAHEAYTAAMRDVDDNDPASLEAARAARNALYDAHCDLQVATVPVEQYKDHTAQAAKALGASLTPTEWDGDTLGALYRYSSHPEGSLEWHADRHGRIGGSDVGTLTGEDPTPYRSASDITAAALAPLDHERITADQATTIAATGPLGRGHAWEPVIIDDYATDHPADTVLHTKATWRHPDKEYVNINIDGALSSDGGHTVDGIIDAKTGSDAAAVADGIPPGYRAQMAYYLHNAGLKRGVVAAKIDDGPTRYFSMSVDEPISGQPGGKTIADYDDKLKKVWSSWQNAQANPVGPKPNKGTFGWVKKPGSESSHAKNAAIARDLAAYRGISTKRATQLIDNNIYQGKSADSAVRDLYTSYDPASNPNRRFVTLDFQTNARSAGKGEVIQTGVVVTDGTGKVIERIDALHGIDPRITDLQGTGASDIHRITTEQLGGKPAFQHSPAYGRIKELLADPRCTLVAHNAQFEKTWLRANGIGAPRVIDTMRLHQRFAHGTVGSTNAHFCLDNNVEYVTGHNAAADADMTSRAFHHFTKKLFATTP